jgi:streptogramin lyase
VGSYTITATFNPSTNGYNTTSATSPLTVSGESVWIVDGGGGTSELAGNGYGISSSAYPGASAAVAIDNAGNVWTVGNGSPLLEETNQVGAVKNSVSSGGGIDAPTGVAIDGNGQVWVANSGNNTVSLFTNAATAVSPSGGFTDPSLSTPSGVAIDLSGSVWITNKGNNSVTKILGAAAPAAPLSTAASNGTTGARP